MPVPLDGVDPAAVVLRNRDTFLALSDQLLVANGAISGVERHAVGVPAVFGVARVAVQPPSASAGRTSVARRYRDASMAEGAFAVCPSESVSAVGA